MNEFFVCNFPEGLSILENSFIATVIGAVAGGAIALYGSIYVQRNEVKAGSAIKRRDVIFIPLYNELLALQRNLQEDPCPDFFITTEKEKGAKYPRFVVWRSFKESSKNLQVPRLLSKSLDKFIEAINFYRDTRIAAIKDEELGRMIRQIIIENSEGKSQRVDLAYRYLPCTDNLSKMIKNLESDTSVPKNEGGRSPIRRLVKTKSDDELEW